MTHESSANREPLRRIPTTHAPAASADIGAALRAARQAKGRTLDAVRQQTRIPKKFLEALEENRLDEFPALVYLRGFLKGYCDYLELDFESLWRRVQPPQAAPSPPSAEAPAASSQTSQPAPPRSMGGSPAAEAPTSASSRSGLAATAASLAVAAGLAVWLLRGGGAPPAPPPAPAPPAALQPLAAAEGLRLEIVFREETWIRVKADGATVFEGLVPENARQEWKARRALSLRTPHPGGLALTLNGAARALPPAAEDGEHHIELP